MWIYAQIHRYRYFFIHIYIYICIYIYIAAMCPAIAIFHWSYTGPCTTHGLQERILSPSFSMEEVFGNKNEKQNQWKWKYHRNPYLKLIKRSFLSGALWDCHCFVKTRSCFIFRKTKIDGVSQNTGNAWMPRSKS